MIAHPTLFTFTSGAGELILEIPTEQQSQAWLWSQYFSHPVSGYRAFLNKLCLSAILPWLEQNFAQAKPWTSTTALPSFWELVNGSAIVLDQMRLILVPGEEIDRGELRVPQEWVDISSWSGDCYLAIQVEPDDNCVIVWGYCTHAQLQTYGIYDLSDRTYCLDAAEVIKDISTLALVKELAPKESIRSGVQPLPILNRQQAQNLISRLQKPEIITPRLEIPFPLWEALIEHGGWRQNLYQQRLGLPQQWSVWKWLESGVSELARQCGWENLSLELHTAGARSGEKIPARTIVSRKLTIAGQLYELRIVPQSRSSHTNIWHFELRNATAKAAIPGGFKLRLLTEDLQPFPDNEDVATTAVELLFVEVACEPGEGVVWETEPLPENYDREILRL